MSELKDDKIHDRRNGAFRIIKTAFSSLRHLGGGGARCAFRWS